MHTRADSRADPTKLLAGAALLARVLAGGLAGVCGGARPSSGAAGAAGRVRTGPVHVSNIKVLSDRVEDVSTLDALLGWMVRPGMSDEEKALAVWETVVKFHHQEGPPNEFVQAAGNVHDPIKTFNVYGYGMCCCKASNIEALARAAGLRARGKGITAHSVPEVFWDGDWHLLDASLICYFQDGTGDVASVDEIVRSVREWYTKNPGFEGDDGKLRRFMRQGGWKKGPEVLATSKFYGPNGWLPAATHGWYSTMAEYDGKNNFVYEYGYSMGYRALFKLRPGERLVRNWSNKGLHVNMDGNGKKPGCLKDKVGRDDMRYSPRYGDIAPGRVGNGTLLYTVPLSGAEWRSGAWSVENVAAGRGISPASSKSRGQGTAEVVFRMHCPYVFLGGKVRLAGRKANSAGLALFLSTNNALDWRLVRVVRSSGGSAAGGPFREEIDLGRRVLRRYDYYVKLVLSGNGEGDVRIDELEFESDIQHSQRALPALARGKNVITVSAGPATDTVTVEPSLKRDIGGKNEVLADFRAVVEGAIPDRDGVWCASYQRPALVTIPVETPGDIVAVRFGGHFRARDAKDGVGFLLSFDDGKSWVEAGGAPGPYAGYCKYVEFDRVPRGTRKILVRYRLVQKRNTTGMMDLRADVDYWDTPDGKPPGRAKPLPLKVTYVWREGGAENRHVHVTRRLPESYEIRCAGTPVMKSITVELPLAEIRERP